MFIVAVASVMMMDTIEGEAEELSEEAETLKHHQSHTHDNDTANMYEEPPRDFDDDLAIDNFDDDDSSPSESNEDDGSPSSDDGQTKSVSTTGKAEESESKHKFASTSVKCPLEPPPKADNDKQGNFDEYIEADKMKLTATGELAESAEDYRNEGYDGYRVPYEEAKANIYDYVTKYFLPPLQRNDGGSIYESACGTAANLLMTLEIIAENRVKNVTVYGSEYLGDSVTIARQMIKAHMPESFHMGSICQADSTNLEHVPSNSMDVVFTGYIDPLIDPLGLYPEENDSDILDMSKARCKSTDEKDREIAEKEQRAQEDWFARWVTEMVRITKPGGSVIIEDVAKPLCEIFRDWGGVSFAWWKIAVADHGWDVDVNSISFQDAPRSHSYHGRRYNVAMRKLG